MRKNREWLEERILGLNMPAHVHVLIINVWTCFFRHRGKRHHYHQPSTTNPVAPTHYHQPILACNMLLQATLKMYPACLATVTSTGSSSLWMLGPRRFTNVFDESKINRIRIFAMLWTEYNDSFVRTKYPSDSRSTQRSNPVIYIKLRHRTIHLLFSIAFAVALTFIKL